MVKLTKSLYHWLWVNNRDIIPLVMCGHTELITDAMWEEYIAWCETEDGKKYLEGGEYYDG